MAIPYDPDFTSAVRIDLAVYDRDLDHDASASAAIVAVDLISTTRHELKLDSVYTEYLAQYLVDIVRPKKRGTDLTVKDCLEYALKNGLPKEQDWTHLGCMFKPPSSYKPTRVSMKGKVIEVENIAEAADLLMDQPVGAKLHVFSPQIDLVGDRIYCGSSGEGTGYVGLRDVIIVKVDKIQGKAIATMKLWYKKRFRFVKVALSRMFQDYERGIEPTTFLIDYCVTRFSVN